MQHKSCQKYDKNIFTKQFYLKALGLKNYSYLLIRDLRTFTILYNINIIHNWLNTNNIRFSRNNFALYLYEHQNKG